MVKSNSNITIYNSSEIQKKIYTIRGEKVMFDKDLANFYGVETKVLNQAVKRNIGRFPEEFMFRLSKEELENWKSQIVTSNFLIIDYKDVYHFGASLKDLDKKWFAFSKLIKMQLNCLGK